MTDPEHRLRLVAAFCTRCGGNQGRGCVCRHPDLTRVTLTELDLELPHDAARVIKAPPPPLLARSHRDRARDVVVAVCAMALLAFGLWIYPHH